MGSSRFLPLTSDVGYLLSAALSVLVAAATALSVLVCEAIEMII